MGGGLDVLLIKDDNFGGPDTLNSTTGIRLSMSQEREAPEVTQLLRSVICFRILWVCKYCRHVP